MSVKEAQLNKIPGYAGAILYIDLSSRKIRTEALDPDLIKKFLGGYGINLKLAADLIPADAEPFSPENKIIIGAGPFNGTFIPAGAKVHFTSRYPLNGGIATGSGGGAFGMMLKSSGYDHVVISGKAKSPVYIKIVDDQVEICPADELWGKDVYETVDLLRGRHEPCSVIPIGLSGENLVKISITSVDKAGSLGRGGLPAVMGSKNLKAIVACQGTKQLEIADRAALSKLVNQLVERMRKWPGRETLVENGMGMQVIGRGRKDPVVYANGARCRMTPPEEIKVQDQIVGEYKKKRKPVACPSCPLGDKDLVRVTEGEYAGSVFYGVHLLAVTGEGESFGRTVEYSAMFNRDGIDRMDFRAIVSFVVALYREGILSRGDLDGLEPEEQDYDTNVRLMDMIVNRRGLGDVLAEGLANAARIIGKGAEKHAHHIKGHGVTDIPLDPRARGIFGTMEFVQMTNPRGAHAAYGGSPAYAAGRPLEDFLRHGERMGVPASAYARIFDKQSFNVGRLSRYSEDWCSLFDCMGLCNRAFVNRFYHVETICKLYAALTGIELSRAELMTCAERNWNLWRVLNARYGFSRSDDRPPKIWHIPLEGDGKNYHMVDYFQTTRLSEADVTRYLDDYYDEREWDQQTGRPTAAKLRQLGLENYL